MKPDSDEWLPLEMDGLVGVSAQMQRVYKLIRAASANNHPVLIVGEEGTEKESAARSIHSLARVAKTEAFHFSRLFTIRILA
jgi:DNA-binding NtrC family response regulator